MNVSMRSSLVLLKVLTLTLLLSTILTDRAEAQEARCNALGANCICSATMTNATYAAKNGTDWAYGSTVNTAKDCSIYDQARAFVELPGGSTFSGEFAVASSGEAITALPSGHSVPRVLRAQEGQGAAFLGTFFPSSGIPTGQWAVRFYKYWSNGYEWIGDGTCGDGDNSNKIAQLLMDSGGGPIFTEINGTWTFYALESSLTSDQDTGWTPGSAGCCQGPGPGESATPPAPSTFRGHWVRYEIILNNATTTGHARLLVYLKNVTDGTPEIRLIDTDVPKNFSDGANWTSAMASGLRQTQVHRGFVMDNFRNGDCDGWAAYSHFMAAAWSTTGNRIGEAAEIEGGSGPAPDTTPPAAPTGISIVKR